MWHLEGPFRTGDLWSNIGGFKLKKMNDLALFGCQTSQSPHSINTPVVPWLGVGGQGASLTMLI